MLLCPRIIFFFSDFMMKYKWNVSILLTTSCKKFLTNKIYWIFWTKNLCSHSNTELFALVWIINCQYICHSIFCSTLLCIIYLIFLFIKDHKHHQIKVLEQKKCKNIFLISSLKVGLIGILRTAFESDHQTNFLNKNAYTLLR